MNDCSSKEGDMVSGVALSLCLSTKKSIAEEEDAYPGFSERLRNLMLQMIEQSKDVAELLMVLSFCWNRRRYTSDRESA